jgi:uncharacterized protein (DUF2236 family)
VSQKEHEACLQQVVAECQDPAAGIFGPSSMFWRVNSEAISFLGAGRAVALQVAHPYVAYAVAEHSIALTDARKRFQGTFENIFAMAFGPLDEALACARGVYRGHCKVHGEIGEDVGRFRKGDRYHANDRGALRWVHATLFDTVMRVHELAGMRLTQEHKRALYRESRRFALLFGVSDTPATLEEFDDYVRDMLASDTLAVSRPAREITDFVLAAPTPALAPAFDFLRAVTAALLPPRLRRGFGLPYGARERALMRLGLAVLRPVRRVLPEPLRKMPEYMQAMERLGLRQPSLMSRAVDRAVQQGLALWQPTPAA